VLGNTEFFDTCTERVHAGGLSEGYESFCCLEFVVLMSGFPGENGTVGAYVVIGGVIGKWIDHWAVRGAIDGDNNIVLTSDMDGFHTIQGHICRILHIVIQTVGMTYLHGPGMVGSTSDDDAWNTGYGHAGDL